MRKTEIEGYIFKNCRTGNFNPLRTLLESYFIIPESLLAYCAVVFAQIANEQTNELNYIYVLCVWKNGDRQAKAIKESSAEIIRGECERYVGGTESRERAV